MKQLSVYLKALDSAREINPRILLIAHEHKSKGTVIDAEACTKAAAEWIVTCKEVFQAGGRLADWRKDNIALLAARHKEAVCRPKV